VSDTTATASAFDLQQFCFTEPPEAILAAGKPQTVGGYTYATDGRMLVRVPAAGPDTLSLASGANRYRTANGEGFPSAWTLPLPLPPEIADASLWQPWPAPDYVAGDKCGDCDGRGRVQGPDCRTCKGHGYHDCPTCGHERDCADCSGRGYMLGAACPYCRDLPDDAPRPTRQRVGDMGVQLQLDAKVRTLPGVRWRKVVDPKKAVNPKTGEGELVQFVFDVPGWAGGGCGLLVPLLKEPS
jgi:hypothetical protein